MRTLAIRGLASAATLLSVGLAGSADSAPARSAMTAGAPAAAPSGSEWGSVPDVGLKPPATAPTQRGPGWGPGGWQGGDAPPPGVAPGGPVAGGPAVPQPGVLGAPGEVRGGADDQRADREPVSGAWRGRRGDGPNYGRGRAAWTGRYNRIGRGYVVPGYLRAPNFYVSNWWDFGLNRPPYGQNWIRYYDDALLIDGYGRVVDTRYGLDWDRAAPPPDYPDYGDGDRYQPGNYDRGFGNGGVDVYRSGPDAPGVTVHRGGDGSTVVVIKNQPGVTTTTTTYYDEVVTAGRKSWKPRKPAKGSRR